MSSKPITEREMRLRRTEGAARQLIHSWILYGPREFNHFDPDFFPTGPLQQVAGGVLAAAPEAIREIAGMAAYFHDAPDGVRYELIECAEGFAPMPKDCGPLLKTLHDHHRAYLMELASRNLSTAVENREPTADIIRELAEIEAGTNSATTSFPMTRAGLSVGVAMATDFVETLLTEGGASVIYGPSNCGKSFWILDLAVAVATGASFRDELEVDQGAVVYVALEGSFGMQNRIEALKQSGRLPADAPLFLCFAPVSLLEPGHAAKLAESVKQAAEESALPCRLVILDTLARAMAGGDENKGQDMTLAVASIDAIRAATGAHVAVVHHCGKDEARGARGHSSLRAAVDTEIEVSRPEGETITTVRVTKQRDMPLGDAMPFSLEPITLGTDRRGKPVTSCVVRHEDEMMAAKPGKAGRKPTCTPEEMLVYLPASSVKEWQAKVAEETGLGRSQFYDHKKQLEAGNRFRKTSTGIQAA